MKKTTSTPSVITSVGSSEEAKKPSIHLTAMELSCLAYYVSIRFDKATEQEKECTASFHQTVIDALLAHELLEFDENGELRATKFGVRWALQSCVFGVNFTRLFSEQVTPSVGTLHAALFALVAELRKRHEETPIYYYKKDSKEVSPFWEKFTQAVKDLAWCHEAPFSDEEV